MLDAALGARAIETPVRVCELVSVAVLVPVAPEALRYWSYHASIAPCVPSLKTSSVYMPGGVPIVR
jgi:hypothetical protein